MKKKSYLGIRRAGPPDEARVVAKRPRVHTHLHLVELGVEQHKRVGSAETVRILVCGTGRGLSI